MRPGWFGGSDDVPESEKNVRYAAASGANVYSKASMEARLLGKLEPNERVLKISDAKGFTKVRARHGSMIGWVPDSKLIQRRPAKRTPKSSDEAPEGSSIPQTGDSSSSETTAPAEDPTEGTPEARADDGGGTSTAPAPVEGAPEPEPTGPHKPAGVGAAVFDPY